MKQFCELCDRLVGSVNRKIVDGDEMEICDQCVELVNISEVKDESITRIGKFVVQGEGY